MIYKFVEELLAYLLQKNLISKDEITWARNTLLFALKLEKQAKTIAYKGKTPKNPAEILGKISAWAGKNNLLPADTKTYRDNFETYLMALFTLRPSELNEKFFTRYKKNPKKATDFLYQYCQNNYYIRTDRIAKNIVWKQKTKAGTLEMAINLSKPEKDPKEIALQMQQPKNPASLPKCFLCMENEGFCGAINYASKQNLRLIKLNLNGETFYFQYSPFSYYNEHSIVFSKEHYQMEINAKTLKNLLEFIDQFPHYFIGSNAELPIVGGSILTHNHYQAGRHNFALDNAKEEYNFKLKKFPAVKAQIVKWPMNTIRLIGKKEQVALSGAYILDKWRNYTDKEVGLICKTGKTQHSTITPIARRQNKNFVLDLILRNNKDAIFHTHEERRNIKRENIGLIEALGLAILPGRLEKEFAQIAQILKKKNVEKLQDLSSTAQHYNWVKSFINKYPNYNKNPEEILLKETALTFENMLKDCAIFKDTVQGKNAFKRFIKTL